MSHISRYDPAEQSSPESEVAQQLNDSQFWRLLDELTPEVWGRKQVFCTEVLLTGGRVLAFGLGFEW